MAHAHAHAQLRTRSSWALDQPTSAGSIFDLTRIFLCPRDVLGTPTTEGVAKVRRVSSQPQGQQPSAVLMRAKATSKRPDRRRCHATAAKRQQWLARFKAPFGATASAAAPHAPNKRQCARGPSAPRTVHKPRPPMRARRNAGRKRREAGPVHQGASPRHTSLQPPVQQQQGSSPPAQRCARVPPKKHDEPTSRCLAPLRCGHGGIVRSRIRDV